MDDNWKFFKERNIYVKNNNIQISITRNEFDFRGEEGFVYKEAGFNEEQQKYFNGTEKTVHLTFSKIGEEKNWIGNFSGVLYFNKISVMPKDIKRFYYKDITGRRNLTKHFGGIKLYRDHFRVRPYGEYGDNDFDWLELSARRNRSPAGLAHPTGKWCVGAEQILGIIDISRTNTNLEDAANRNGIQEGKGFTQLKNILLHVISEFEHDRQFVGRKLAEYDNEKDELVKQRKQFDIENIVSNLISNSLASFDRENGSVLVKKEIRNMFCQFFKNHLLLYKIELI